MKTNTEEVKKKTQKKSVGYAVKALDVHVETIIENELIEKDDLIKLKEILKKVKETYIKKEYGI